MTPEPGLMATICQLDLEIVRLRADVDLLRGALEEIILGHGAPLQVWSAARDVLAETEPR